MPHDSARTGPWLRPRRLWQAVSAPQLLVLSFLGLTLVGWAGFLLLPGLYTGERLGWVDALFMATSAVCVTGLSVVDVSRDLTGWGQAWLLLLIQAGGLGMLTLASLVVALIGGRSHLAVEEAAAGPARLLPGASPRRLLLGVAAVTFAFEGLGALLLWAAWWGDAPPLEAAWLAIFHAVSAFCNAGFSLFSDSMEGFAARPGLLLPMAALIVVGGLGFPVLVDLRLRLARRHARLTTHSRLVLGASAVLLAGSAGAYLVFEAPHTLAGMGWAHRGVNALFMAVTARTAGFSSVLYDEISNESLFLTLGLMWVGGGPTSVSGGVKVTTVALLALLLLARLRGDRHVSLAGRTVPEETVHRSTGLAVGGLLLLGAFVFVLLSVEAPAADPTAERARLVRLAFEVQSALGTVGLSLGVTEELSPAGRGVLIPAMLLGRVGPLAVVGAMVRRQRRRLAFRYAHEDVAVG